MQEAATKAEGYINKFEENVNNAADYLSSQAKKLCEKWNLPAGVEDTIMDVAGAAGEIAKNITSAVTSAAKSVIKAFKNWSKSKVRKTRKNFTYFKF